MGDISHTSLACLFAGLVAVLCYLAVLIIIRGLHTITERETPLQLADAMRGLKYAGYAMPVLALYYAPRLLAL